MDWKDEARQWTNLPTTSFDNAKAIRLMLDHWPDEPEQCDYARSMAFMANTIQAAHKALGTAVGDDLVMACERLRKERDDLQTALAEQMAENGEIAETNIRLAKEHWEIKKQFDFLSLLNRR